MVCGFSFFLHNKNSHSLFLTVAYFFAKEKAAINAAFIFVGKWFGSIICPAEEQRRPSISSDRPIQHLYPKHISLFRMRLRRTDPAELPGWG